MPEVERPRQVFNVYCDESCHLPNDGQRAMVLGAVWCPASESSRLYDEIRAIKVRHGLAAHVELKWVRVSAAKLGLYLDLVELFFQEPSLHFRGLIVPDKKILDHERFRQDHDDWYYKMYFSLLKGVINRRDRFRVYLDIKDTRSAAKVEKLHNVLCNSLYDFEREAVARVQTVHSDEVQLLQLADVLIGALSYANRFLTTSEAKLAVVQRVRDLSHYDLVRSTLLREEKFNIFRWVPRDA